MKTSLMMRSKGQVYSVGNYLMTGKVLGKGHFARVEEATHRIIGKKVAIKIIDLTCIKEDYARRNLHREPTVMARLRHPCIAALYETMMHGPRLYVVMEAAGGGDLCALVLGARGPAGGARGLPEGRARALAAQLVSAVKHMHARGVVHRDLKMENIMLDFSKTFIKIVDFGLSNVWSSAGGLHTPCGSLEYAAPELFRDTRRYGPELDLWSVGVIVYGMVTGTLPFVGSGGAEGEGRSRPQLRAAIARGFSRKHRAALLASSPECRAFIQQLLEPNVESRMKAEEAARHRWLKRPALRMRTHPLEDLDLKTSREIYKQISDLCSASVVDIASQIKADPYGAVAGMYNIKAHLTQMNALPLTDPLWSATLENRPLSPPEYKPHRPSSAVRPLSAYESKVENHEVISKPSPTNMMRTNKPLDNGDCISDKPYTAPSVSNGYVDKPHGDKSHLNKPHADKSHLNRHLVDRPHIDRPHIDRPHIDRPHIDRPHIDRPHIDRPHIDRPHIDRSQIDRPQIDRPQIDRPQIDRPQIDRPQIDRPQIDRPQIDRPQIDRSQIDRSHIIRPHIDRPNIDRPYIDRQSLNRSSVDRPKVSIVKMDKPEHQRPVQSYNPVRGVRAKAIYKVCDNGDGADARLPSIAEHRKLDERGARRGAGGERAPSAGPARARHAPDKYENWRAHGNATANPPPRILLQSNATTIKRASLGNITSPHSSTNSYCKSERAMPVGWYSTRSANKDATPSLQRLRRTAPIK